MLKLKKIILISRKNGINNYNKFKNFTNDNLGKEMIVFCSKTIYTSKISSLGREKDTDIFIGLDNKGWIEYKHDIEHMVGEISINNEIIKSLNNDDIIEYINSKNCTIK